MKMQIYLLALFDFFFACSSAYDGPFTDWSSAGASLTVSTRAINALYEESFDPHCIWLIGGNSCSNCVYCYNITSNTMINYDTLTNSNAYSTAKPAAVIIDGIVYYMTTSGGLYKYDIVNTESTYLTSFSALTVPCLVKHPNNTQLYTLGATTGNAAYNHFFIYDISNDTQYTGNSLTFSRLAQSCVVHNYNTDYPYLYVFAGDTIFIEKIKLDDNILTNTWQLVDNSFTQSNVINIDETSIDFSGSFRHGSIVSYLNYIYFWNAYYGSTTSSELGAMYYYNVDTNVLKYLPDSEYPLSICCSGSTYVSSNNRIYTFGGLYSGSVINTIYKTNEAIFPPNVTNEPTSIPSAPSLSPSTIPSNLPSTDPTVFSSKMPTGVPNVQSVTQSTNEPGTGTQPAETTTMTSTEISNNQGSNNGGDNGSSGDSSDSTAITIVLIVVAGLVLSVCCLVVVWVVKILLPVYEKRVSQQNENNNNNLSNNNNNNIGGAATNNMGLMTDTISTPGMLISEIDVELAKIEQRDRMESQRENEMEGEGRNNDAPINSTQSGLQSYLNMGNDNNNNNNKCEGNETDNRKVGEIMLDGKVIEINYKDLMAIIKMKENDEETIAQKGENHNDNENDNQLL